jgi:hypothetical protein
MIGTAAAALLHVLRTLPALTPGLMDWTEVCHNSLFRLMNFEANVGREALT